MKRMNRLVGLVAFMGMAEIRDETLPRGLSNLAHPEAFNEQYLTLVGPDGNSEAGRTYRYKTEDVHASVDGAGYFNGASDRLKIGDLIDVTVVTNIGASNEAVATYGRHIVLSNAAGVVDTSDVTVGTVTDSD